MAINVVLAPDDNYAPHAAATMASVLMHHACPVHFWILDGGLSAANKTRLAAFPDFENFEVDFVGIDTEIFSKFPESGYITRAMWYRLKVGSLLPDSVERCLYLDCDTIVNANLEALFARPMQGCCAGVGIDCVCEKFIKHNRAYFRRGDTYFNSGVMLINLSEWRQKGMERRIFSFLAENPKALKLLDQTILNINLKGRICDLGIKYNFQFTPKWLSDTSYFSRRQEYRAAALEPAIVHFVGEHKPWKPGYNALNPYYRMYFAAQRHTAWQKSESEIADFYRDSERLRGRIFRKILFKALRRKPWYPLRRYFWQRVFL